jgi:alpha-methylacyl-CoA racemase
MAQAASHPHVAARGTIVEVDGVPQPAPAPRFSATPAALGRRPAVPGEHTDEILEEAGFSPGDIAQLRTDGTVA